MKLNQKNIYKPIYKKLLKLKENVLNKDLRVFLKLKKKNGNFLLKNYQKKIIKYALGMSILIYF